MRAEKENTKGRRKKVKVHVVCFEEIFTQSPSGGSSRMFT